MKKKAKKPEYIEYEDGTRVLLDEDDVPELTEEDFRKMRPFKEMHPELYESWKRMRGRPRKAVKAKSATIRLSPKVDAYFRATGKGWQTRINAALEQWLEQHS